MRILAWMAAGILTGYGAVQTSVGLLVQAGAIHASMKADHRALAWHAYLWDPWFLVWGLLVAASLITARYGTTGTPTRRGSHGNGRFTPEEWKAFRSVQNAAICDSPGGADVRQ